MYLLNVAFPGCIQTTMRLMNFLSKKNDQQDVVENFRLYSVCFGNFRLDFDHKHCNCDGEPWSSAIQILL